MTKKTADKKATTKKPVAKKTTTKTAKKLVTKKTTTKTVKKVTAKSTKKTDKKIDKKVEANQNNKTKIVIRFKSYSFDKFYMLTSNEKLFSSKTKKLKITAKEFCKQYIPYEYEGWEAHGTKFKFEGFEFATVNSNGIATFINKTGGPFVFFEIEKIDTNDMPEDKAIFSDSIDFV